MSKLSSSNINNDRVRQTIVVNQNLATLGSLSFFVNLDQYQIPFTPSKLIVRQLIYCNISGVDTGTFLLWSNITNQYIGACYVGIQSIGQFPETIINLTNSSRNYEFRLSPALSTFTPSGNPTGNLTMTLEFVE